MSTYFIANIRIDDYSEYSKYILGSSEVFKRYKGRYIAVDDNPTVLEGSWDYTRLVLIEFPDRESLNSWYYSEDYQRILKHRLKAAECNTYIVDSQT